MEKGSKYFPTIGLEIHAELKTRSKMFCSCRNDPDEDRPNVNVCPICLGHPGTLPVLNESAIAHVLSIGLSVNGTLADFTEWDRKNYFYPDIPKGYQISQYKFPLVSGGELAGVAIERIHLEEDTAKSTHDAHEKSLVDFNRSGVPLMELVTKPVIHDASAAVRFAKELQLLLRYLDIGDANMEKGEMRVEANVSVAKTEAGSQELEAGDLKLGTKTEVKNLNSFKAVEQAIDFEIARQTSLLESGDKVVQETRGWDDSAHETYSQRSKESSYDYRYFPDPDIPKLKISEIPRFARAVLAKALPELPWTKRERFKKDFAMTDKEVAVFVEAPKIADYYEAAVQTFKDDAKKVKLTTNYLLTDYLGILKKESAGNVDGSAIGLGDAVRAIPPVSFAELIGMAAAGELSSRGAKDLLAILFKECVSSIEKSASHRESAGISVKGLAQKSGLIQKSDAADIIPTIDKVISDHAAVAAEYKKGKTASLQFLIGQAMKATKGAANPEVVKKLLLERLG